ncbi:hypothetical protein B4U80_11670 [Leptotrombidium deliense]|uniref:C2 domain-containing protein n=1 Tax=Leptotrombidium deliense TaxID=299467 RepID=A0A443S421_9ACAR|nr:hypothetical protein B4U80_11670 [Leptotrombidium deliense]
MELSFTFPEPPTVVYVKTTQFLKPLEWLSSGEHFIESIIANFLVLPKSVGIKFDEMKNNEHELDAPKAMIRIDLLYASQLIFQQQDIVTDRIPSTCCTISLENSGTFQTTSIESSNPIWKEYFTFPVTNEKVNLQINIYSRREDGKEQEPFIYKCADITQEADIVNGKEISIHISESKGRLQNGDLTFRVNTLLLSDSSQHLLNWLELKDYHFPSGVISVLVNEAVALQNLPVHEVLHSRSLHSFVRVTIGNQTCKTHSKHGNMPVWNQVFHFICTVVFNESIKFSVCAKIKKMEYELGFVDVPTRLVLSENNFQTSVYYPLQGISKDAYLSVTIKFKAIVAKKGFMNSLKSSEKRVIEAINAMTEIKTTKRESPSIPGPYSNGIQKLDDNQVHVLLRFRWQRAVPPNSAKVVINVIQALHIPKISGQLPNPYIVLELIDKETKQTLDRKQTVIKSMTSNPMFNETKYFENINEKKFDIYLLRISVYFKTVKNQHSKVAESTISLPLQPKENIFVYENWYSLVTSHRHTYGFTFIDQKSQMFEHEEAADEDSTRKFDISSLFETKQEKVIEQNPEESIPQKLRKYLGFEPTETKEKTS